MSISARNVNWLLSNFVAETVGVEEAIAVSSDGLLMAMSSSMSRGNADKLAAAASGLRSLADGAARVMGKGGVNQVIVEMADGFLFTSTISGGSTLAVITARGSDLGLVGYEMTMLVERVGPQLTPELITELKNSLVP
ncbi:MAG: roadblock/LC7 domain-containing protein [Acidimicrobiia bacterium]|nr:roadblock/LC7 domain-containing protein [Acidimicrobiia bacterium]